MQQMLLARSSGALALRCEAATELARCQGLLGERSLQRSTLDNALDACCSTGTASRSVLSTSNMRALPARHSVH